MDKFDIEFIQPDISLIQWMNDWLNKISEKEYENSFNEISDEWIRIQDIGRFKGLKPLISQNNDIGEINITLKYDQFEK